MHPMNPDGAEAWLGALPGRYVSHGGFDVLVTSQIRAVFRPPEIVAGTREAAREAPLQLDLLRDDLFPGEKARIAALLFERVDTGADGLNVRPRVDRLIGLAHEMRGPAERSAPHEHRDASPRDGEQLRRRTASAPGT